MIAAGDDGEAVCLIYCVSKILESAMIYQQLVALHKASLSKQISVRAFVVDLILVPPSFSSQFL